MERADSNPDIEPLSLLVVGRELQRAGILSTVKGFDLERLPSNPERRDYLTRASFRVFTGKRTVCHLTIARDLSDLSARTNAFAGACPQIACHPLFYHRHDGWDYLGVDWFDGRTLDNLLLTGDITPEKAMGYAARVLQALERTHRASTSALASEELDRLFNAVYASPMFGGLDNKFLRDVIFPFVRAGALQSPCRTRWTNGDLVSRNILVDTRGHLRLIDYELAARTHFFCEDEWRWKSYSEPSLTTQHALAPRLKQTPGPWQEAYFHLNQMLIAHAINGAHVAVAGSPHIAERLIALASLAHKGFRASVFYSGLTKDLKPIPSSGDTRRSMAQIFWSPDGQFTEAQSQFLEYPSNITASVSFSLPNMRGPVRLRFDPACAVGLLQIYSIRVRRGDRTDALLALDETNGWKNLEPGGHVMRLPDSTAFNLVSLSHDPILFLPGLDIGATPAELKCDISLRYTPNLATLPEYLKAPQLVLANAGAKVAELEMVVADTRARLEESTNAKAELIRSLERIGKLEAELASALALRSEEQRQSTEKIVALTETVEQCRISAAGDRDRLKLLQREVTEGREALGRGDSERRSLQAALRDQQKINEEALQRIATLELAQHHASRRLVSFESALAAAEEGRQSLEKAHSERIAEGERLGTDLTKADEQNRQLHASNAELRTTLAAALGAAEVSRQSFEAALAERKGEAEKLRAELTAADEQNRQLNASLSELRTVLAAALDAAEVSRRSFEAALAERKGEAEKLGAELARSDEQCGRLNGSNLELQASLAAALAAAEASRQSFEAALAERKAEAERLGAELADTSAKNAQLQAATAELRSTLASALETADARKAAFEAVLTERAAEVKKLGAELAKTSDQNRQLQTAVKELQATLITLEQEGRAAAENLESKSAESARGAEALAALEKKLNQTTAQSSELTLSLTETGTLLASANKRSAELEAALEESRTRGRLLEQEALATSAQLAELQRQGEAAAAQAEAQRRDHLARMEEERTRFNTRLELTEKALAAAKQAMAKATDEASSLGSALAESGSQLAQTNARLDAVLAHSKEQGETISRLVNEDEARARLLDQTKDELLLYRKQSEALAVELEDAVQQQKETRRVLSELRQHWAVRLAVRPKPDKS